MRGQRAVYGPSSVGKALGSLPVVAEYSRRLDLVGIIDRACPMRDDVPILTHGQVIEALVANRLTSPAPLVGVAGWAREWAVAETFGITTSALAVADRRTSAFRAQDHIPGRRAGLRRARLGGESRLSARADLNCDLHQVPEV